ncbi:MAG: nuclear transport factor 2 family protein [Gammaproteobacteria bacterium]
MTIQDENLAARLTRLEDIEAIRQLKARYCEICDDDHNTALITSIFTEDGTWEGKGIGKAEGHQEIRELFTTFQQAIKFSQHMVQNPIIEVDGNKATARWYFFGMFKYYRNDQARWQAARYHETYRKIDGEWKISTLKIAPPVMSVKYEEGW